MVTGTVYAELTVYQALEQRPALHAAACFLNKPVMPELLLDSEKRKAELLSYTNRREKSWDLSQRCPTLGLLA